MTAEEFRRIALKMSGATESMHMGHPDFRVRNKVFATLGYPGKEWVMVKLTPDQQEMLAAAEPDVFQPVKGRWGKSGSTRLLLKAADKATAESVPQMAWQNICAR